MEYPRSYSPPPWTGLGRKERKELHQQPQSRTHRAQGVGGQREKWEGERKADRRQDALRRRLEVASTPTPLSGELGVSVLPHIGAHSRLRRESG